MLEAKFKVGDVVRVIGAPPVHGNWNPDMTSMCGNEYVVCKVIEEVGRWEYHLENDTRPFGHWYFHEEWLVAPQKFIVGETVYVIDEPRKMKYHWDHRMKLLCGQAVKIIEATYLKGENTWQYRIADSRGLNTGWVWDDTCFVKEPEMFDFEMESDEFFNLLGIEVG